MNVVLTCCEDTKSVPWAVGVGGVLDREARRHWSGPQSARAVHLRGFRKSPLPDSNRRPPPYHAIQRAAGGSRWQRFGVSSSHFRPFRELNLCPRLRPLCSITVPSQ